MMRLTSSLLFAALLLAGCAGSDDSHSDSQPHWSYGGSNGPDQWASLSPEYAACAGDMQSPIDLAGASPDSLPPLEFEPAAALTEVHDTGHAIQVDVPAGGALNVGEDRYELAQLHIHTPSEHTVSGTSFPAEIHFVHRDAEGRLAVVGALVREAEESAVISRIEPHLPGAPMEGEPLELAPYDLLPAGRGYQTYKGSLTTPPCTEGVRWIVLNSPITMSDRQLALFEDYHPHNARPVQGSPVQLKRSIE